MSCKSRGGPDTNRFHTLRPTIESLLIPAVFSPAKLLLRASLTEKQGFQAPYRFVLEIQGSWYLFGFQIFIVFMFHLCNENSSQLKEILSLWEDVIYYERAIIILFSGDPFFNIISYSKHSMPCQVSIALSLP